MKDRGHQMKDKKPQMCEVRLTLFMRPGGSAVVLV